MTTFENLVLDLSGICALIKTCGENNVACFKSGDLVIRFHRPGKPDQKTSEWPAFAAHSAPHTDTEISGNPNQDEKQQEIAKDALERDEISAKEEDLAIMRIEDPFGYERLLASRDLEDANEDHSRHPEDGPNS